MFILLKFSSIDAVNITGDNVSTLTDSFHDLYLSIELFSFCLCCSVSVRFFDDVNVLLLHAMCPQLFYMALKAFL